MTEFFRTRAALVRATVASLILVGVLFAFVFPTRTWLQQRSKAADAQSELTLLHEPDREARARGATGSAATRRSSGSPASSSAS